MTLRTLGLVAAAVVAAFVVGWCTGASNRTSLAVDLSNAGIRADLAEARAAVLEAQVSLTRSNFGDARRSLERARAVAVRLQERLREAGQTDRAGQLNAALAQLEQADQLSGALDAAAADAAAEALRTLEASVPTVVR